MIGAAVETPATCRIEISSGIPEDSNDCKLVVLTVAAPLHTAATIGATLARSDCAVALNVFPGVCKTAKAACAGGQTCAAIWAGVWTVDV